MPLSLALYQPDIPQNTGTLIRLAACMDIAIHVIHPTGFAFSDKKLRRAGMDYAERAKLIEHDSFAAFEAWRGEAAHRLVLLTTKAERSAYEMRYDESDILMVGRESAGVPDNVAAAADLKVRIPMDREVRSLNVAIAAALVLGEAMRQTDGFKSLS